MKKLELSSFISKLALILLVLTTVVFTSCENFLQGEDVKEEISKAIEYNNAATYVLHLVALKGSGDIKTPAGEEVSKKVSDTFNVKFVPEDNHKFIKWEAVISGLGQNEKVSDYIEFEDEKSLETKVTFKKASNSITITPVCPELLAVKEFNFKDEGTINPRDSSIVITLNQEIPEECKSAFSISIPGLPEDKTFEDYFMPAEISGKVITIKTKYSQTQEKDDLIPVDQNSSKTISITLSSEKLFYTNKEYSEENDVYLDKDVVLRYTIGSQTSKPTDVEFTYDKDQCSMHVNDIDWSSGQSMACSVGQTVSLYCKPKTGWSFCGWQFERTYSDNGVNKTELISADSLAELNLKIDYSEDTKDTYGYDTETRIAQAKLSVNNYIEGTITVSPVIFECLAVEDFNMKNADKVYPRDNPIILTFNKPVKAEYLENIIVRIPGLAEGVSAMDFFKPAVISGNKVTLQANTDGKVSSMIPVPANGTVAITVIIPETNFYYEATSQTGKYNVGLYSEKTYTYTINSETTEKTLIKLHVDGELADYSTLRVGEVPYTETAVNYSVGSSFSLSYKISDDYRFYGWKISYDSEEFVIPEQAELLSTVNLSVTYKDENLTQPTFTIEKSFANQIVIQPYVIKIPEAYITIDGEHGTFTPGKGKKKYKIGVKNPIEFDAVSDYAFIRWKIINEKTGNEIIADAIDGNNGKAENTYITFTDASSEKTEFELIQIPAEDEEISLSIQPELVERPRIISNSPSYVASGVLRDTTIQVMFDTNMEEDSIYYTDKELEALTNEFDFENEYTLLPVKENDPNTKYYGYKKGEEVFFKNILITNSRNDENLNRFFKAPVFENARTLSIPVNRATPINPGVRVSVMLNENFFYKTGGKDISMSRAEKWQYLVNGKTDNDPPTIGNDDLIIKDSKQNALLPSSDAFDLNATGIDSLKYFAGGKFSLFLKAEDNTAPDSKFNIVCEKLYDKDYQPVTTEDKTTLMIEYNNPLGTSSEYGFTDNNNNRILADCYLDDLDDGIYSMYFVVKDGSGNENTYPENIGTEEEPDYPKYYFCMDKVAPDIDEPEIKDGAEQGAVSLSWNPALVSDYHGATISYREWGTDDFTDVDDCVNSCSLALKPGTRYEIITKYKDYAGNVTEYAVEDGFYTRPAAPSVTVNLVNDSTVTLNCTKPTIGNSTDFKMILKGGLSGEQPIEFTTENGVAQATVEGLDKGIKYEFEVCTYDSAGDKYSLPCYTSDTTLPSFTTKPNAPREVSASFISNTNQGTVNWTKPVNGITGYIIYCSSDESFQDTTATKTQELGANATTVQFTGLTAGTRYYVKAVSYFGTKANQTESEPVITNTKCAPVTGLSYTAESNTALNVSWTAPAGNFDYYTVWYKQSSAQTWETKNVNKTSSRVLIDGLTGATDYNVKVVVNGLSNSTAQQLTSCKTCPNPANDLYAEKKSDTSFEVTWNAPDGNYDGYKLYYSKSFQTLTSGSATSVSISKGTTSKTITVPDEDEKALYYLKLETYIGSTLKTYTAPIACSLALDNVRNLTATPVSSESIKLSWTNPTSDFDGIKILYGDTTITLPKTTTNYPINNLAVNTSYDFTVTTYKIENGETLQAQSPVSGRTYSLPVSGVMATAIGPKSIKLDWTYPTAGSYSKVYIYNGDTYFDYWSSTSSYSYTDKFNGGTKYTFKFVTTNDDGVENPIETEDNTCEVTTPAEPVKNLKCSSTGINTVSLSWQKAGGNYSGFNVYYKLHSSSNWSDDDVISYDSSTTTSCTVTGLIAGSCYDFKVVSYFGKVGNIGTTSDAVISSCYTKPNEPTAFTLDSRTATSLTFKWTKPVGTFTGYRLYYKKHTDSSYSSVTPGSSATNYTISNLSPGQIYDAYLVAYTNADSNYSSTSTLTKATKPGTPGYPSVSVVNGGTKVSWGASLNGATKYYVYYKPSSSTTWSNINTTNTSYTFSNTSLSNGIQYNFKVVAYNYINSESLYSEETSSRSFYTPPAAISTTVTIYSDDAMGTVIIRWLNPSSKTDTSGINVYLDNETSYQAYVTFSAGSYSTAKLIIPNYVRGSSHTFYLEPYHKKNGSEVRGPKTSVVLTTSDGNLVVNGTNVQKSSLTKVIGSTTSITNHPTDGGSFVGGRNITLTKYSIGTYEVTNALWYKVTGSGSSNYSPKANISWQQAIAFCNKLSALQGLTPCYEVEGITDWANFDMSKVPSDSDAKWWGCKQNLKNNGYHLPTCAQWEFAARGGDQSKVDFWYGVSSLPDWALLGNYVVYGQSYSAVVGSKTANRLGIYDMIGNVWEILTDWGNNWPAGTFTDPYCEARYHSSVTTINGSSVIPYGEPIMAYRAGGCYADNESVSAPYNNNLRNYATYSNYLWACTYDSYTGLRLCRNVTY